MREELDQLIEDIMVDESTELSAEAKNVLHGAKSTHPWAAGKSDWTRVLEVTGGLAGRRVHAQYHLRLERLRDRLAKQENVKDQSVTQLDRKLRTLIQDLQTTVRGTDRHHRVQDEIKELKDARRKKLAPKTFDRMLSSLG